MANKRFISKDVLDHDVFVEMSKDAQILYVRLMLSADDDGFISSPKKILRGSDIDIKHYQELCKKRYVLDFPSGVCVIKHWGLQNKVPKDRYKATSYSEEKNMLQTKDDGSYTEKQRIVDETSPQYSIDKNRIDKNSSDKSLLEKNTEEIVKFTQEDMDLTDLFIDLIQKNNPAWQLKGRKEQWAEDIGKIIRIDGRTYKQVEYMIRWVQADSFWNRNILSGKKLRDKFNDLIPKLKPVESKGRGFVE